MNSNFYGVSPLKEVFKVCVVYRQMQELNAQYLRDITPNTEGSARDDFVDAFIHALQNPKPKPEPPRGPMPCQRSIDLP